MYIVIYIFSSLMRSDTVLRSGFDFPFVTSTPFIVFSVVGVETTHSKRILSFVALFNLMNGTIKFFGLFLLIFFEDGKLATVTSAPFGLLLFLNRKSMNISISGSKKEHLFSRIKGCFFIINVTHTKTLVFSFLLDKIGWCKNNRQICLQYITLYMYTHSILRARGFSRDSLLDRENTREE